jgi:hypothetical protein
MNAKQHLLFVHKSTTICVRLHRTKFLLGIYIPCSNPPPSRLASSPAGRQNLTQLAAAVRRIFAPTLAAAARIRSIASGGDGSGCWPAMQAQSIALCLGDVAWNHSRTSTLSDQPCQAVPADANAPITAPAAPPPCPEPQQHSRASCGCTWAHDDSEEAWAGGRPGSVTASFLPGWGLGFGAAQKQPAQRPCLNHPADFQQHPSQLTGFPEHPPDLACFQEFPAQSTGFSEYPPQQATCHLNPAQPTNCPECPMQRHVGSLNYPVQPAGSIEYPVPPADWWHR